MNAVLDEQIYTENFMHDDFKNAADDEVMRISERLLEQHKEAYKALANA